MSERVEDGAADERSVTFPCPHCGAALPMAPTRLEVTCLYCGVAVAVPRPIRAKATAHAARVGPVLRNIDEGLAQIGVYRWWPGEGRRRQWTILAAFAVTLFGTWAMAMLLGGEIAEGPLAWMAPVVIFGTMALLWFRYDRAQRRVRLQTREPPAAATATCERCGGPIVFDAGSAAAKCRACAATSVAGAPTLDQLASAAERRAVEVEGERDRAEQQMPRPVWWSWFGRR